MPKINFTSKELQHYFSGSLKHKAYDETIAAAAKNAIHAEGIYPQEMIEERRPSESLAVKNYRKKIFQPITKPIWGKVLNELNKIRRSSDWNIKYPTTVNSAKIAEGETLKAYCEENYPFFTSVTSWVFKALLPEYLKDANAVIAVMPTNIEDDANVYKKPFGFLFASAQVIDYVQDDYAVIKSTDKVIYEIAGVKYFGDIFFVFTTQTVQRWEQSDDKRTFALRWEYKHSIGKLPVFKVEGLFKKSYDNTFVFESRLSAMLPRLDEAIREYNDLQAEVVQNVYNEKWEIIPDDCPACKGSGTIKENGFMASQKACSSCEGSGLMQRGPFSKIQIRMPMGGEGAVPLPPAGYIQKDTSIVKIQDERIDKHEYKALSAINMEYLSNAPLNQSGVAKEVDKDALNNFVHSVAEDIVSAMDRLYFFINEYRYNVIASAQERKLFLPFINVPEKFDLLSTTYLEDQIAKAKEGKTNQIIINAMEEDYVHKKFIADAATASKVLLNIQLDPLSGISEEDKMLRLSSKGITEATYIISCNIKEFVDRALDEHGDAFLAWELKKKKELIAKYADEILKKQSAKAKVLERYYEGE